MPPVRRLLGRQTIPRAPPPSPTDPRLLLVAERHPPPPCQKARGARAWPLRKNQELPASRTTLWMPRATSTSSRSASPESETLCPSMRASGIASCLGFALVGFTTSAFALDPTTAQCLEASEKPLQLRSARQLLAS